MTQDFVFRGEVPAVVTPFTAGGDIDYEAFSRLVAWHIGRGVGGICVAGDNGEAWTLSVDERRRLAAAAVRTAAGRVPVAMGASATTAKQAVAYAEAAAGAGADALMIGPQSYVLKATIRELVERFETVHRAVPLPIMLYNSPRRTGIGLTIESMSAIADAVKVIALKESSRDFFYLTHAIRTFSQRLAVLVGPAPYIIPGVQLGAAGFVSSGPELFGERAKQAMGAATQAPDRALRDLHFGFTIVYEVLMSSGTWPAALKAAHALIGQPGGVPREPVLPLDRTAVAGLAAVLRQAGIAVEVPQGLAAE
jgi:4-hydroxy-tetrahydrodipicolinate synthase